MKKGLFIFVFSVFTCLTVFGQNDTLFYDINDELVTKREDAIHFRSPVYEKIEAYRYQYTNYYLTGEKYSVRIYSRSKAGIREQGEHVWYYRSGQIKEKASYSDGRIEGDVYEYFENGDLMCHLFHDPELNIDSARINYLEHYDKLTKEHTVINGNGTLVTYYGDSSIRSKGAVVNKLKEGEWNHYRSNGDLHYTEVYNNGILQRGTSYDKSGKSYSYTISQTIASLPGGKLGLLQFLASITYPMEAREDDIEGTVYLGFVVDEEGYVTDIDIARSSGSDILDDASIEHMEDCPDWEPGTRLGQPVKINYVVPIRFKLSGPRKKKKSR